MCTTALKSDKFLFVNTERKTKWRSKKVWIWQLYYFAATYQNNAERITTDQLDWLCNTSSCNDNNNKMAWNQHGKQFGEEDGKNVLLNSESIHSSLLCPKPHYIGGIKRRARACVRERARWIGRPKSKVQKHHSVHYFISALFKVNEKNFIPTWESFACNAFYRILISLAFQCCCFFSFILFIYYCAIDYWWMILIIICAVHSQLLCIVCISFFFSEQEAKSITPTKKSAIDAQKLSSSVRIERQSDEREHREKVFFSRREWSTCTKQKEKWIAFINILL